MTGNPCKVLAPGVREVRIHADGEHRVIYIARFEEGIYILHAFQKKRQKTTKKDLDIARARIREVFQKRGRQ